MQNEEVVLFIDLNVKKADEKIDDIVQAIKEIGVLVGNLGANLVKGFVVVEKSAKNMETSLAAVSNTMNQLVQHMNSLVALYGELQSGELLNELSVASNICTIIQTVIALMDDLLVKKLKNMAADIQIIALYAVDYVKSFGLMIAQLAASAAAWVRDTAVKVANTAASWAQIAATTAWKVLCVAATAVTTAFGAAMTFLTSPIGLVVIAITALIAIIVLLVQNWDTCSAAISQGFQSFCSGVEVLWASLCDNVFNPIAEYVSAWSNDLWNKHLKPLWDSISALIGSVGKGILSVWKTIIEPLLSWIVTVFAPLLITTVDVILGAVGVVVGFISDIINSVVLVLNGLIQFIAGIFTGNWERAWQGIVSVFQGVFEFIGGFIKGFINTIILAINVLIGAIYSAIAGIINAIGGVSGWIGDLIGVDWHISVQTNPPQIPYLAQGAVLPANRPFLAVVGDQRHGTNVEAPLATIQEAVAVVIDDYIGAMMAGFEALLAEQKATRQAVESIHIGDDVLYKAVQRRSRVMAIARGGL